MTLFLLVTAILFVAIIIGIPIAFAIGITTVIYIILTNPQNIAVMPLRMFSGVDSFILMAIPLFVLAAELMVKAGISRKLFDFVRLFFGRYRGGLAHVNIMASTVFGSISGSALSDVAGLGKVEIEAMKEEGYKKSFACAITAASALQSPLIPPSNTAVLYGGIMNISVGALFLAGVIPGLLIAASQILYIVLMGKKLGLPKNDHSYEKGEVIRICKDGFITLTMPALILVGILGGFFTPTEAAGMAVFYALLLGLLLYKNITFSDLFDSLWSAAKISANLFVIISFSSVFAWVMAGENIPHRIAEFLLNISSNPYTLLFIVNIILIIVGMWMETGAAIILFAPILAPIMYSVGIHPVHFAMVMILNLTIGLITPPVGVLLYAATSVGGEKFEAVLKDLLPFILLGFLVVFIVTYVPEISLILPKMMGFT